MNAQMVTDSTSNLKVDSKQLAHAYLKKSKHQKTGAWILLSVGFVVSSIGALTQAYTNGYYESPEGPVKSNGPVILIACGAGAMLGSIPLFIASKKNKQKAHLYLSGQPAMINPQVPIGSFYSVVVQVPL